MPVDEERSRQISDADKSISSISFKLPR